MPRHLSAPLRFATGARRLFNQRTAGNHPLAAVIVYGWDWSMPSTFGHGWPLVCVNPYDYRPDRYDWRALAGLPVYLFDRGDLDADWPDDDGWQRVYYLAGELSLMAAQVLLRTPRELYEGWGSRPDHECDIAELARDYRIGDLWPVWWPERRRRTDRGMPDGRRAAA